MTTTTDVKLLKRKGGIMNDQMIILMLIAFIVGLIIGVTLARPNLRV